jgi:high-affinity iron transporter
MLPSYILSLREGLEAALVIGIVLGALRKIHTGGSNRSLTAAVWAGTISALVICIAVAIGLNALGLSLEDPAEAIFEGLTMLVAAGILTWMIFWMSRQARFMRTDLESGVQRATKSGARGLFLLAFVAVLREGVELALFLTAAALASGDRQTLIGALLGLASAILLGIVIFATSVRLDLRRFFLGTGILLILFAAGLVARGVGELVEVGWLPAIIEHLWDLGHFVSEESFLGQTLGALFGYSPSPSLMQALAYAAYCGAVLLGLRAAGVRSAQETAQAN